MFENVTTYLIDFINGATAKLQDTAVYMFNDNFGISTNELRLISVILISATFVLFITITFMIYLKSLIFLIKSHNQNIDHPSTESTSDAAPSSKSYENELIEWEHLRKMQDEQQEKDKKQDEKTKEIEKLKVQEEMNENFKQELIKKNERIEEEKRKKESKVENKEADTKKKESKKEDFDWQKGKVEYIEGDHCKLNFGEMNLHYKQNDKPISDLVGLILDMISRGVDDLKIAQVVMFRTQGNEREDQVLQVISSIREFIALCNAGKFKNLITTQNLPSEQEALYSLAKGDNSLALLLIQTLIENSILSSNEMTNGTRRDESFKHLSEMSCIFGTVASLNDVYLASNSFELAIELYPGNINAWSRAADMYYLSDVVNKAVWAYKEVIAIANEEFDIQQMANANKMLSQYHYDQGNSLEAAKLYNSSKQYYDFIGINRRLDRQELEIIEIIESHQNDDLNKTISNLLNIKENVREI